MQKKGKYRGFTYVGNFETVVKKSETKNDIEQISERNPIDGYLDNVNPF